MRYPRYRYMIIMPRCYDRSSQQVISSTSWSSSSSSWPYSLLPLELYQEIKEWLHEKDYLRFLNSSQTFNEVKYMTRRISLSHEEFEEFVENEEFRERLLSKIADPYYQLTVVIPYFYKSSQALVKLLQDLKCSLVNHNDSLVFPESYNIMEGRKEILWKNFNPIPIEHFSKTTVVSNVKKLSFNSSLPAAIINISVLSLFRCDFKDGLKYFHSYGQLVELNLHSCTGLQSLTGLERISASLSLLTLTSLNDLQDISTISLLRLKKCELKVCDHITDYSPLTSSGIRNITLHIPDLRPMHYSNFLPSTRSLNLLDLSMISVPVFPFSLLHFLRLFRCDKVVDLSSTLYHIPFLEIVFCQRLTDISGLGGHQKINIHGCGQITDFTSLKNVPCVHISRCDGFTRGSDVETVKHLTIDGCSNFHDVSALGKVPHLELSELSLKSLSGLYSVPVIGLNHLKVQDYGYSGIGGNRRVTVISMERVQVIFDLFPRDRYNYEYLDRDLIIFSAKF